MDSTHFGDGGHGPASDARAFDGLVLGHVPGDDSHPGAVGGAVAAATRTQLRNGLGPSAQAAPGHGELRVDPLHDKVEVDETYLGGHEVGLKGQDVYYDGPRRFSPLRGADDELERISGGVT